MALLFIYGVFFPVIACEEVWIGFFFIIAM